MPAQWPLWHGVLKENHWQSFEAKIFQWPWHVEVLLQFQASLHDSGGGSKKNLGQALWVTMRVVFRNGIS